MLNNDVNYLGQKFGHLTVVDFHKVDTERRRGWDWVTAHFVIGLNKGGAKSGH